MTTGSGHRIPGATLLKIAPHIFDEHVVETIVRPTIADLQREMDEAGPSRAKRLRARWRGYVAFWRLTFFAPFASWGSPALARGAAAFPDVVARLAVGSIVVALIAVAGPFVGAWVAMLVGLAAVLAAVMHRWVRRHPSELPDPLEPPRHGSPQINFSSTDVAGNIGGLIFAIGTVLIVAVGVPSVIWFLFAAAAAGCVVAWGLAAWHTNHPESGRPENHIVLRS
jgi:hypothetical protein